MSSVLGFFVLGLSLAAPIGPVNAAQLDKGIKKGFLQAWLLGMGAMIADAVFLILIYLGVVHFLTTPFMKTFLWLFGSFILFYSGTESLLGAFKLHTTATRSRSEDHALASFTSGFLLAISSPLTILFWLGIYGSVLVESVTTSSTAHLMLNTAALFAGILLWDIIMAGLASTFRAYLTPRSLSVISIVSGLSLLGFGFYFGKEAFEALFLL
ncbi:LysE family transporter [Paenibacillus agricola]|uniref:LysE family transporter n=1 Tax=Paenibacillus agricola TaxID=2716264 RepID=A0ABX0JB44_9BACL|nr:LysE family transporter [Paenibacillus agricola]NHN32991.1 LysE family transporter [Paenibacillus agricola]